MRPEIHIPVPIDQISVAVVNRLAVNASVIDANRQNGTACVDCHLKQ